MESTITSKKLRSKEARQRRNKIKRDKIKAKKYSTQPKNVYEMEEKIMKLERENVLLKKSIRKQNADDVKRRPNILNCTVSIFKLHKNKSSAIVKHFKSKIPEFKRHELVIKESIGSGAFGSVSSGYIKCIKQIVAVKTIGEKSTKSDILAEAKIAQQLSGHPNFPYFFGFIEPNHLLFEFIGDNVTAPSLRDIISRNLDLSNSKDVCISLCRALHHLHQSNILHNDIHPGNILLRNTKFVKLIDFGKATLADDPVLYEIKPGTRKHERYNKFHQHLGFELRNIPGSYTSYLSDIFSLGYCFDKIAKFVTSKKLGLISCRMMFENPEDRPSLGNMILSLSKL